MHVCTGWAGCTGRRQSSPSPALSPPSPALDGRACWPLLLPSAPLAVHTLKRPASRPHFSVVLAASDCREEERREASTGRRLGGGESRGGVTHPQPCINGSAAPSCCRLRRSVSACSSGGWPIQGCMHTRPGSGRRRGRNGGGMQGQTPLAALNSSPAGQPSLPTPLKHPAAPTHLVVGLAGQHLRIAPLPLHLRVLLPPPLVPPPQRRAAGQPAVACSGGAARQAGLQARGGRWEGRERALVWVSRASPSHFPTWALGSPLAWACRVGIGPLTGPATAAERWPA